MSEEKNLMDANSEKPKKKIWLFILIGIITVALIVGIVFLVLNFMKPKYQVIVNTGGGTITKSIVVNNNVIEKLPEITPPEGKKLVSWVNEDMEAIRPNLKITENLVIEPVYRDDNVETVTLKFETGTSLKIKDIIIPKNSNVILPIQPEHEEWKFLYWVDKDGFIILKNQVIEEDTTIYAYWFKPDKEKVTISFDTDTTEKIGSITINKGSTLLFPTPKKTKIGFVFRGWMDETGNVMTNDTKIEKNITLKANWKEPYTCPEGCTPNEGGATCNKENVVSPTTKEVCPNGSILYYGKCITKTGGEDASIRQCSMEGDEMYYNNWCMKIVNKVTEYSCPEGYNKDGDNCKKIDTLECTAN
ncbi:MAG: InlB B-repeat-containing protein [Bacilli bacterium]|nr:InlB B-repeat-containing protein [Bacilli bacterium]